MKEGKRAAGIGNTYSKAKLHVKLCSLSVSLCVSTSLPLPLSLFRIRSRYSEYSVDFPRDQCNVANETK